ncbi:hypothetical protein ACQKNX_23110 [Lysinibacillus sp. NPDC093712]|uniref:hypothetical protein n=1 Tax=Lysinibacillus sp. NPDC093712 TaxID=3390579 RepID=UPI003D066B7B
MKMRGQRKRRSDAKVDFKPTVPLPLKDSIERLADITNIPIKDVTNHLIVSAINNVDIISSISKFFKREIRFNNTLYFGNPTNPSVIKKNPPGTCDRISTRVSQKIDQLIDALAYAMRCTPHRACAVLLEQAMLNYDIVNNFIREYLMNGLDKDRLNELQKVLNYINSMDDSNEYSWADLLSLIVREVHAPVSSPNEMVEEFLVINNWRDNS